MNNFDCLLPFLERRIATKNTLVDDHKSKLELFRNKLVEIEKELILTRQENSRYALPLEFLSAFAICTAVTRKSQEGLRRPN